jgi:CheY-like chemotaxis protein
MASLPERRVGPRRQLLLVADDEEDLRNMWLLWLDLWGFASIAAHDGRDAVAKTSTLFPAVILMDLSMPRMDGLDAVRALRAQEETARIPVIGVTAHSLATERAHLFRERCDALLEKPVDPDDLLAEIRRMLRRGPGSPTV